MYFITWLKNKGIEPDIYLKIAKEIANVRGYDPNLLNFADDEKHKLMYDGIKFGANGYNDFILYNILYDYKFANLKRINYRKRASKVKKQTKSPLSRASLSFNILW